MLQTDDDMGPVASGSNLDTLLAEDAEPDANLDDRLLRRDLKSRIFGSSGTVRIGRYEILRRIGRGGMGTVYVAHDPELDRKIALKVLRPDRRSGRDRMLHEARALARLAHPNVVTVHEVGVHDDRIFLAMELVQGQTLRCWLESNPGRTALFDVFAQAARGLRAAHQAGLVHRDFKPDNVLIGDDGRVRVVDFGVVKATDSLDADDLAEGGDPSSTSMPELTHTGQLLGTPAYMAAEQFMGQSVDARTDVFAFCVSLYEALAGRRPFPGEDAGEVSRAVLAGSFAPLREAEVPPGLVAIIEQGLAREPDDRPRSMDGLVEALTPRVTAAAPTRRPRGRTAVGLAFGLFGLAGAVGLTMGSADEPPAGAPVAAPTEADNAQQTLIDEGFVAITTAADDVSRRRAAEIFLDRYGEFASASRRAIAHSIVGDVLWRTSCPEAVMGLCIVRGSDTAEVEPPCGQPLRGNIVVRSRDAEGAKAARDHLDAALALGGVEPSDDFEERALFGAAIGRARVQRLDHKLEEYLGIEMPTDLDFDDPKAEVLARQAFDQYYERMNSMGGELKVGYESVKDTNNPQWVIVAAARTGLVMETPAEAMRRVPLPASFGEDMRGPYCEALHEKTRPAHELARDAYAYCVERATKYDIVLPEVELCRTRLARFAEIE